MRNLKLKKRLILSAVCSAVVLSAGITVYANSKALPAAVIENQEGISYLVSSDGKRYSGWFVDASDDWYYFDESNYAMKTGWYHDEKDGYWYYLNPVDGKMQTGWQTIDGKEYFFQPVRDMGNYHFNNAQEKWLYTFNDKVPYGAMYAGTTAPDGSWIDENGVKASAVGEAIVKNGWVSENGAWYYYQDNVKLSDQWLSLNGIWYYLKTDGSMVSESWYEVGGKLYYFGSDGAMYVNQATPDGNRVDGNGVKTDTASSVDWNQYIGVYDLEGATGPGYQMVITAVTDSRICGAYVQIIDGTDEGRYAEFDVPLSGNRFTVTGTTVKMQMGIAYEISGWEGKTGSFSKEFELAEIDGEKAIIDSDYTVYGTYLRRINGLGAREEEGFWVLYRKVDGTGVKTGNTTIPQKQIIGIYLYDEGKEVGYFNGELNYNHVYTLTLKDDNTYEYIYDNGFRVYETYGTYTYDESQGNIAFSDLPIKGVFENGAITIEDGTEEIRLSR